MVSKANEPSLCRKKRQLHAVCSIVRLALGLTIASLPSENGHSSLGSPQDYNADLQGDDRMLGLRSDRGQSLVTAPDKETCENGLVYTDDELVELELLGD